MASKRVSLWVIFLRTDDMNKEVLKEVIVYIKMKLLFL